MLLASVGHADLVVDANLGILPLGATGVAGDTATGANNADYYANSANPEGNWGNELVYEFQLNEPLLVELTLRETNGDPDFFLLFGLATILEGNKNAALDDLDVLFLDDALPDTASFGLLPAGTYYLSIDAFTAFDPPPAVPATATFDLDITTIVAERPAVSTDLGTISLANEPLAIDSFGSAFDTLLGVFDGDGFLVGFSDDEDGTFQSQVDFAEGLPAGEYYVALGGFDTSYQNGYIVEPQPGSEGGDYVLNYPGGPATGMLATEQAQWFRFAVAVPEPATWALLVICMVLTPARRSALGFARRLLEADTR
jgi:hypothetical protein